MFSNSVILAEVVLSNEFNSCSMQFNSCIISGSSLLINFLAAILPRTRPHCLALVNTLV